MYEMLWLVDFSRLNLQQPAWYFGKAEPLLCGHFPLMDDDET